MRLLHKKARRALVIQLYTTAGHGVRPPENGFNWGYMRMWYAGGEAPAEAPEGRHLSRTACCGHCGALEGGSTRAAGPLTLCSHELHLCECH